MDEFLGFYDCQKHNAACEADLQFFVSPAGSTLDTFTVYLCSPTRNASCFMRFPHKNVIE